MSLIKPWLERLRFPQLFLLLAGLWLLDVFVPDPILFLDEAMLAVLTIMIGSLRRPAVERRDAIEKEPEKNVTPRDSSPNASGSTK